MTAVLYFSLCAEVFPRTRPRFLHVQASHPRQPPIGLPQLEYAVDFFLSVLTLLIRLSTFCEDINFCRY